jgi:putative ABC transport system permease protein
VTEQIQTLGSNLIPVLSSSISAGGVRLGMGSQLTITEDDAWAIQREIATVAGAAAVIRGAGQVVGGLTWPPPSAMLARAGGAGRWTS